MTRVSSPHRLHYPMQVPMGNKSQVNPDSYHTTRSLCDKHDYAFSLGNITFRITPRVSYTYVPGFSPRGLTVPFLLCPTHIIYIYFYVLNHETSIGRHPNYMSRSDPRSNPIGGSKPSPGRETIYWDSLPVFFLFFF